MEVYEIGYSCNWVNCSSLPTVHRSRLTKCYEPSCLTLLYCSLLQSIDWLMVLTEINKVALQCKNKLPFPAL